MKLAESWDVRLMGLMGAVAAILVALPSEPEIAPVPDELLTFTCAPISETPTGWCGFDEGPRISLDEISARSRDAGHPVCGLLQGYADAVANCATRNAGHVFLELRVIDGHAYASARSGEPDVARCMKDQAELLVFHSDAELAITLSVSIRAPYRMGAAAVAVSVVTPMAPAPASTP